MQHPDTESSLIDPVALCHDPGERRRQSQLAAEPANQASDAGSESPQGSAQPASAGHRSGRPGDITQVLALTRLNNPTILHQDRGDCASILALLLWRETNMP